MDLMQRRRQLMAMQSELPGAYRRVEYLQSSGGQCIVTDIIPDMTTDIVIADADLDYPNHNETMAIFGSRVGNNLFNAAGYTVSGHKFYAQVGNGRAYKVVENGVTTPGKHKFIFDCVQKIFVVDDAVLSIANLTIISSPSPYNLFCQAPSGNYTAFMHGKIYGIKFVGKGIFIPCVRKSDSKPGMYDTVTKTFYTNAGTGEFTVGPDVN